MFVFFEFNWNLILKNDKEPTQVWKKSADQYYSFGYIISGMLKIVVVYFKKSRIKVLLFFFIKEWLIIVVI